MFYGFGKNLAQKCLFLYTMQQFSALCIFLRNSMFNRFRALRQSCEKFFNGTELALQCSGVPYTELCFGQDWGLFIVSQHLIEGYHGTLNCASPPLSRAGGPDMTSYELFMDESQKPDGTEPSVLDLPSGAEDVGEEGEELLAISKVIVELKSTPLRGFTAELDVVAQSDKTVTIALSPNQNNLLGTLKLGARFDQAQFFSPVAVFRASCFVSNVQRLGNSSKQETYLVEITVESR
jgi:hypothetical protein